jgi:hypothetical protein
MEDFEESAQEPTVCCNIQSATQPTYFSDFQLNSSSSSNQSTVATSGFPTDFPHEPPPSISATPIDSTSRNLEAASLSSQLSI